jgi:hypothetical protein
MKITHMKNIVINSLIAAAGAQTSLTHGDPAVVDAAEFFARVTLAVREGVAIPEALRAANLAIPAAKAGMKSLLTQENSAAHTAASTPP